MELYIIVVGLFMIAEGGPGGPVDLLFLRSGKEFQDACGAPMEEHRLALKHWFPARDGIGFGSIEDVLNGAAELSIEISSGPPGELERYGWDEILDMADLLPDSKIRLECQGPDALSTCLSSQGPLLAARMRLTGGTLSPIEYDLEHEVDLPPDLESGVARPWSFSRVVPRSAAGSPPTVETAPLAAVMTESSHSQQLFNGILFQTQTRPDAEVTIHWGPHPVRLDPVAKDLCRELGSSGECRVAVIYNIPPHTTSPHQHSAAADCRVLEKKANEECFIDRHFNLNYLLLKSPPPPEEALIPVLCQPSNELSHDEGELPLGSRCIPPRSTY